MNLQTFKLQNKDKFKRKRIQNFVVEKQLLKNNEITCSVSTQNTP
jgi:hypothetical protein